MSVRHISHNVSLSVITRDLETGSMFFRKFAPLEEIGSGADGTVTKYLHTSTRKFVAVKEARDRCSHSANKAISKEFQNLLKAIGNEHMI